MTWSLDLIVVGGLLRSVAPGVTLILVLTAVFGIGAGFAGTLLPSIIKERFADQSMLVTGISAIAINGAAALAAAVAVPLAGGSGHWRPALVAFGVWDVALALAWVALTQRRAASPGARAPITHVGERRLPWGRGRVWAIAFVFGLQGTVYYGLNAWLAAAAQEHGWSAGAGGVLVALLNFTTLPATLVAAAVAGRLLSKRAYLVIASGGLLVATVGLAAAPAVDWLWPAVAGLALGSIFPLCMSLPIDLGRDPSEVAGVSGLMLGFGYSFAALAPLALGEARDASGSFSAGMWMLAGLAMALVGVCVLLARNPAAMEPEDPTRRESGPSSPGGPASPTAPTR